ncbi:hypothetical protein ACHAXR_013567 [Thalassiosira sp. AJA248-18]
MHFHALFFAVFKLIYSPLPSSSYPQLFFSFFKTLVGKEVAVELKNDVVLTGTLHSVDQYLNIKLTTVNVVNQDRYPQLTALKNCFIRGSVVRYVQINPTDVDTELLQDATRKENSPMVGGAVAEK